MALWMVRGDRHGQYQKLALEKGFAYHFSQLPDVSRATSRKAIEEMIREAKPEAKEAQIRSWAAQLFALAHRIKEGDLIAMPLRNTPQIALGEVIGPYQYRMDLGDVHHIIPVKWIREDLPRTSFGQDLLYSLGSARTVCQVKRNNAETRIREILQGKQDPGLNHPRKIEPGEEDEGGFTDVEQLARDQIMSHLETNFKGHEMARLVDAILRAEGYVTEMASPGPDGGVDILAGRGTLGLEGPKLCVQVKSSKTPADVNVFRALQGSMHTFNANQGLLVSWGGFTKATENEARLSFFSVRLWDANDLLEAIFKNYDRLPEELQNELPLKRIWALVTED